MRARRLQRRRCEPAIRPRRLLVLHDVERPELALVAHRALGRVRAVAVLEGRHCSPSCRSRPATPTACRRGTSSVSSVGRKQLEGLEPGRLRDLAGPGGEAPLELLGAFLRDRDGIDADDAHAGRPFSRSDCSIRSTSPMSRLEVRRSAPNVLPVATLRAPCRTRRRPSVPRILPVESLRGTDPYSGLEAWRYAGCRILGAPTPDP